MAALFGVAGDCMPDFAAVAVAPAQPSSDAFWKHPNWIAVVSIVSEMALKQGRRVGELRARRRRNQLGVRGLQDDALASCLEDGLALLEAVDLSVRGTSLTIVTLSNPVLYPATFSQVGDLGPILVRVRRGRHGTRGAM